MTHCIRKLFPLLVLFLLWPAISQAHGVNVFCWAENDDVQCRSRFSGGRPVHNGTWRVLDASSGKELLSGSTNAKGRFSFAPPQNAKAERLDLKVVCEAAMGHRDSWLVRAGDYLSDVPAEGEEKTDTAEEEKSPDGSRPISGIGEEEMRRILRDELAPLRKELSRLREPGVELGDVLSGLGYILGLVGIWALATSRRQPR